MKTSSPTVLRIRQELRRLGRPGKAKVLQGFFKTGPGEYGEGDVFIGVTVPEIRQLAKKYESLSLSEIRLLLRSAIHEERLLALILLVDQYRQANNAHRKKIYDFYIRSTRHINNWDLVDVSAAAIVGAHLATRSTRVLDQFARSPDLWKRRIAIVATHEFIRRNRLKETFRIAQTFLHDREDLIHKATGWMLREAGKRDTPALERFLKRHGPRMPRTMLRYAIERFPAVKRRLFLGR